MVLIAKKICSFKKIFKIKKERKCLIHFLILYKIFRSTIKLYE